ncbi:UvrD-helicase domain-containing protein [Pelistega europaea]|uniref:ATP-dependent DNA helicase Rep n=1 Tax=Pelistega europaea TaxID=106147 RepID=A0A7Y4L842_9BURK|nr:UvrD-helicase domain-containing protein [Pelistega europaea]NOL48724.1 UvrD-helicase domain-containing protein [Pelistega europaea]
MIEHLGLNPTQKEAVLYLDGPCLVLAGAGSGKTRVITQKIAYLINQCGYDARSIIALTFTNKAAKEMVERVSQIVEKKSAKGLTVCTFHALGVRFLRQEAKHLGLKESFSILDSTDAGQIIQEMLATTDKVRIRIIQQQISLWKNDLLSPDDVIPVTPDEREAQRIYRNYEATLKAYQSVDFDDLIRLPVLLMRDNEEVRDRWQKRVKYLLVDEYQDTNVCQYEWVKLLTGWHNRFTAVGDDDQAIYAWRGATIENLAKLTKEYPNLKVIKLEQNYRSVDTILTAANRVISHNPNLFKKTLWSTLGKGEPIQVISMENEEAEAETVGMRISAAHFNKKAQWKDFAVLYRGNHQARIFEQAFRQLRIPYSISGGQSFFDKAEIRDILAYMRLIANEDDDPAFIRSVTTPRRGVGQTTLTHLGEFAVRKQCGLFAAIFEPDVIEVIAERQLKPLMAFAQFIQNIQVRASKPVEQQLASELLDEMMDYIRYEDYLYEHHDDRAAQSRWQNVLDLIEWLKRKAQEEDMRFIDLVQHIALITMLERNEQEQEQDAVTLSTLHASKGLEFPYVHMVGVEEGLLPHMGKEDEYGDPNKDNEEMYVQRIQEERRLMYVGITRAQYELTLTWCKKRKKNREELIREPSRFIAEMGLEDGKQTMSDPFKGMSVKERLAQLKQMLKS